MVITAVNFLVLIMILIYLFPTAGGSSCIKLLPDKGEPFQTIKYYTTSQKSYMIYRLRKFIPDLVWLLLSAY